MKNMSKKGKLLCLMLVLATNILGANGLPFYDKLEFGIKIVKVIGGVIALISFIAAAAFSVFTVTLTNSQPAFSNSFIWATVFSTSSVGVFVIDWIIIGFSPPIYKLPIFISLVFLLSSSR